MNLIRFFLKHKVIIILVAILTIAVFMRFFRLDSLPPGLHPDEAANGLDVFRIFEGDLRPAYNTNGPREALFFYLQAAFVGLLGNTILALRIAPAIIGTLAVGAVFLWARSWFGIRVGLIAAFLMAVTPWAITFSRDGFRASMVMLFVPLTLWLLTKAYQTYKTKWFIMAGISLGLGFYTYLAWRLFPAALIGIAGYMILFKRQSFQRYIKPLIIIIVTMVITLLPLVTYGLLHPESDILSARSSTSFMNPELNKGNPAGTLLDTAAKTALMFNFHGDENYRHNLGGAPQFNVFVGGMFILGVLICLVKIRRLKYVSMLALFGAMLLPEILTAEGIPHALRAIGVLPVAVVFAGLGVAYLLNRWNAVFPINSAARTAGAASICVLLGLSAYQGYAQYFIAWANAPETKEAYSHDAVAIGNFLIDDKFDGNRYVVIDGYSDKTVEYLAHGHVTYSRLDPHQVDEIPVDEKPKQFAISRAWRDETVKRLKNKYPNGRLAPQYSSGADKELFVVYTVNP